MFLHCKREKKHRGIQIIWCLLILCLLAGCSSEKKDNEPKESNPVESIDTNESTALDESKAEISKPYVPESVGDVRLEDFSPIEENVKDDNFHISYDETLQIYERTYEVQGEYDLNGDGIPEHISAELQTRREGDSYVEVNGIKESLLIADNPTGEVKIIDLDSRDNYLEIAIFDDGPSGDPCAVFFRYDGENLYYIGNIDRYAWMDGMGKLISRFHMTNYFQPQFFSAWGTFYEKDYVIINHDVEQYIGKSYEVNGSGYFIPLDEKPEKYYDHVVWDMEAIREFRETQITLLDLFVDEFDRTLNWFYVELPDGERGLLYFWIGD